MGHASRSATPTVGHAGRPPIDASSSPDRIARAKHRFVELLHRGLLRRDIARTVGIEESRARTWTRTYLYDGLLGLLERDEWFRAERTNGSPLLSRAELARLATIVDAPPRAHGLDVSGWTTPLLREVIARELGVRFRRGTVADVLRRLGYVYDGPPPRTAEMFRRVDLLVEQHSTQRRLADVRVRAIEMLDAGAQYRDVMGAVGVGKTVIAKWRSIARTHGIDALRMRDPAAITQHPPIARAVRERILRKLRRGPAAFGLAGTWWSDHRLSLAVEIETGVRYPRNASGWVIDLFAGEWDLLRAVGKHTGRGWVRGPNVAPPPATWLCEECGRVMFGNGRPHFCEVSPLYRHFGEPSGYLRRRVEAVLLTVRGFGEFTVHVSSEALALLRGSRFAELRVRRGRVELSVAGPRAAEAADVGANDPVDADLRAALFAAFRAAAR